MTQFETLQLPLGKVRRRYAPIISLTLLALPKESRPSPVLACATCPTGSWGIDEEGRLACHCAARRYVSWVTNQKMLAMCDDREAALIEQELKPRGDGQSASFED